jgi:hypothetical protein
MTKRAFGTPDPLQDARRVRTAQMLGETAQNTSGPIAGPGITVDGDLVGISGNVILLYDSSGAVLSEYPATQAGLVASFAAATSGDTVLCPKQIPIACTSGITLPAGVTLRDPNLSFSGFSGTGVTMSAGSSIFNFSIVFDGSGAVALGVLASGLSCSLIQGDVFVGGATANTGYELSGLNQTNQVNTTNIYANVHNGTTAIGIRLGDNTICKTAYATAHDATNNIGVSFFSTTAAVETCAIFLDGWGFSPTAGSYGMQIEAGKYGRIVGGFAVGVAAGLLIGAGATALVYGLQWSALTNNGTITYLPGDRGTASANGLDWFNVEDYGAVHDGGTDDTTAIQDAIDAAAAAGGGVVYFPKGVYLVGGALQDGARGNAQLLLPSVNTSGEQLSITLLGETLPGRVPSLGTGLTVPHATTIKSTLNSGAGGALLGGWGPGGSYQDFTLINLRIENLAFQMHANPVLSALNLSHVESIDLVNVVAHTGEYQVTALAQPTTATSFGVVMPNRDNGAWSNIDGLLVLGFYNGIQIGEHARIVSMSAFACYIAAVLPQEYHATWIGRLLIAWSTYGLKFTGAQHILIDELNIEHHAVSGAWYDTTYDIDDGSNNGIGRITYHVVVSGTGADDALLVNGGSGLHLASIHDSMVSSITAGTGLTATPNPIISSGTIALNAALNDLTDVDTSGEGTGDIIYDNAGTWLPYPLGIGTKITAAGSKIRFGNVGGSNYLEIDTSTGNLRLVGNATAWDDFRIEASIVKPGATAPNWKAFGPSGNIQALMFEASHHDEAQFELQMPHDWLLGSKIYPHVHWTPVNTTAGNVVWELEYIWANIGDAFGAPSNLASDATAAGGVAWAHKLTYLKDGSGNNYIDGAGKTLSSMLLCRLHRNSNSGSDTLNQDVAFLEVDFHYQIDGFGSDEELVKDTSASLLLESGDILLLESGDRLLLE